MRTPVRPGPAAYITLGLHIAVAATPVAIRITTAALDISLGRPGNLALFVAGTVLLTTAGAHGAYLIVRYFRTEAHLLRGEVGRLHQRVEEVENRAWWGDSKTDVDAEDAVELTSKVVPFRRPARRTS